MNSTEIVFSRPWLLLLIIPALAVTMIPYFCLPRLRRKTFRKTAPMIIRSVIVVLLCLVIAGIDIIKTSDEQSVAIVIDLSESTKPIQQYIKDKADTLRQVISKSSPVCVVAFASDSIKSVDFSQNKEISIGEKLDREASDISSAIEYASSIMPSDRGKRIIVFSDGNETDGSALDSARYLSTLGIRIDGVYFDPSEYLESEAQITSLKAPSSVFYKDGIKFTADIDSSVGQNATLILRDNGKYLQTYGAYIEQGSNLFEFEIEPSDGGTHVYSLTLQCKDDTEKINNAATVSVEVVGMPSVLVVSGTFSDAANVKQQILSDCNVTVVTPRNAPKSVAELCKFDEVVFVNVNASDLPNDYYEILDTYVSKYGRTLLTIGGDDTYALGNMEGSEYENLLPVSLDYRKADSDGAVALMLVIDCSRSMIMKEMNFPLAKEGAIMCAEAMHDCDYVGLISFSGEAKIEQELIQATKENKDKISRVISSLEAGAGTRYTEPLTLAYEALRKSDCPVKHVIFLSDGQPGDSGFYSVAEKMGQEGISVSTIGLGYYSSSLVEIAGLGGGKSYYVESAPDLPDIMLSDAQMIVTNSLVMQKTVPIIKKDSALTLDIKQDDMPSMNGYLGSILKDEATAFLVADNGDPIYASWQYGNGLVASFMSDLSGYWSHEWYTTSLGDELTRRLVTTVINKSPISSALNIYFGTPGKTTSITVETPGGEYNGKLTVSSLLGTKKTEIQMTMIANGIYSGIIDTPNEGVYKISASLTEDGTETAFENKNLVKDYPREYDLFNKSGRELLSSVVNAAEGLLLDEKDDLSPLSKVLPKTAEYSKNPLIPIGIILAVLILCDIAIRKLSLKDVKNFLAKFRKSSKEAE